MNYFCGMVNQRNHAKPFFQLEALIMRYSQVYKNHLITKLINILRKVFLVISFLNFSSKLLFFKIYNPSFLDFSHDDIFFMTFITEAVAFNLGIFPGYFMSLFYVHYYQISDNLFLSILMT